MNSKVLVILGSSRRESNTAQAVRKLIPFPHYDLMDLNEKQIRHYTYESDQREKDDFDSIIPVLLNYEVFVFATPVYWYSMSGRMKIFFDRLTELLYEYKKIGKALKGRKVYLIASGGNDCLPEGFEIPFKLTAEYFDMEFVMSYYQKN